MNVYDELNRLDKAVILAIARVSSGDGHTIFTQQAYRDAGMPEKMIAHFAKVHVSDTSDPKKTIFTKKGIVGSLKGIYGLDVVETIVRALDLPESSAMGRGFRAGHAIRQIEEALK